MIHRESGAIALLAMLAAGCSSPASGDTLAELGPADAQSDAGEPPPCMPPSVAASCGPGALDSSLPDTGAVDAGADSTVVDAGMDASDSAAFGIYVDAVNGNDWGNGTQGAPFNTLDKALHVATSGATIWLAAGQYTGSQTPIPDGVGIQATTAGQASLFGSWETGTPTGIIFAGSGFLRGVVMNGVTTLMSAGTVTVDGVQFFNIPNTAGESATALYLSGTAHVILTPGGLTNYIGGGTGCLAGISGGTLEVHGGAILNAWQNPLVPAGVFHLSGGALLLDGVTVDGSGLGGIYAGGSSTVTVQNKSVLNNCYSTEGAPIEVEGTPTVVLDDSKITNTNGRAVEERNTGGPSVTLRNGAVIDGSASDGILLVDGTVTLNGATISNNKGVGVNLGSAAVSLSATNSVIKGNGTGIRGSTGSPKITLRGTQVVGSTDDGIYLSANDGTSVDLGTVGSPGGNRFTGNNTSNGGFANLNIISAPTTTPLVIDAVGNTWDSSIQGADATGHFPTGTTFTASLSAVSVTGQNVNLLHSGSGTTISVVATP